MSLQKFIRNQPFHPRADDLNAMVEAARAHRTGRNNRRVDKSALFKQCAIFKVRNDTGGDRASFEVVGLGTPLHGPSGSGANLLEFQRRTAFIGNALEASHIGKFAIYIEPAPEDGFGRAVVQGIVPVMVDITNTQHRFCDALIGDSSKLVSGLYGSAQILWKETSSTGEQWCVVRLGNRIEGNLGIISTGAQDDLIAGWAQAELQGDLDLRKGLAQVVYFDHGINRFQELTEEFEVYNGSWYFPLRKTQVVQLAHDPEHGHVIALPLPSDRPQWIAGDFNPATGVATPWTGVTSELWPITFDGGVKVNAPGMYFMHWQVEVLISGSPTTSFVDEVEVRGSSGTWMAVGRHPFSYVLDYNNTVIGPHGKSVILHLGGFWNATSFVGSTETPEIAVNGVGGGDPLEVTSAGGITYTMGAVIITVNHFGTL